MLIIAVISCSTQRNSIRESIFLGKHLSEYFTCLTMASGPPLLHGDPGGRIFHTTYGNAAQIYSAIEFVSLASTQSALKSDLALMKFLPSSVVIWAGLFLTAKACLRTVIEIRVDDVLSRTMYGPATSADTEVNSGDGESLVGEIFPISCSHLLDCHRAHRTHSWQILLARSAPW